MIPDAALDEHIGIVGKVGSGKSYAARGLAERLLDRGSQVVVIDPTGVWYGLRSSPDGDGPGFPIPVFGGDHADVPIDDASGARLADVIVARRLSCVIDTAELLMSERQRFMTAFLGQLYLRNKAPLHLIIDEADEIAPQRPMPDQTLMLNRIDRIVRRGRVRGLRAILITQRPAVLHKDVLSQVATLIAMKLTSPQDRAAIGGWIEGQADREAGKAVLAALPRLALGEGFGWAPGHDLLERQQFPRIKTLDTMATPTDGAQAARLDTPRMAAVEIADLAALLAPPAGPETQDGSRAGILDPEYQLGFADGKQQGDQYAGEAGYRRGVADGRAQLAGTIGQAFDDFARRLRDAGVVPDNEVKFTVPEILTDEQIAILGKHPGILTTELPPPSRAPRGRGAECRILAVLAQHRERGWMTAQQWATLAGMKRTGGTWGTYVSRLRTARWIEQGGLGFRVTPEGFDAAGRPPQRAVNGAALRATWARSLGGGPARLLGILADAGSPGMERAALARHANMAPTGGTFGTYLSRLRSNGLILEELGRIALAPELLG